LAYKYQKIDLTIYQICETTNGIDVLTNGSNDREKKILKRFIEWDD